MATDQILRGYSNAVKLFKQQCLDAGMSEDQFRRLYNETLEESANKHQLNPQNRRHCAKIIPILGVIFILTLIALRFNSIYSHLQDYIYPGLKFLRRIAVPLISLFPSLTDFSQDTCLLQNPFFSVEDMDCWPCSSIANVQVFDVPVLNTHQQAAPFVYKTDQKCINTTDIVKMYERYQEIFDTESPKIQANYKYYVSSREIFSSLNRISEKNLYIWKFNAMNAARLLRQVIPRPTVVPKFGQSTERYLIIDNSMDQFKIPDTDCGFSFVLALSGSRDVVLRPAEECRHQCRSLSVHLKEKHLLWYNWWYWKPVVMPTHENKTFIAHVGSYC